MGPIRLARTSRCFDSRAVATPDVTLMVLGLSSGFGERNGSARGGGTAKRVGEIRLMNRKNIKY